MCVPSPQFLQQEHALDYVKSFDEIISIAHEALTKIVGADSADVPSRINKRSSGVIGLNLPAVPAAILNKTVRLLARCEDLTCERLG